jgi:hypothetical protein
VVNLLKSFSTLMVAFSIALAPASSAFAQPANTDPKQQASALFGEATSAMVKADFATACPKLEEVVRLIPDGLGAKLALGDCYVGLGKLATAQRAYVAAGASAAAANNPTRQAQAQRKADELNSRLARLTLTVSPEVLALPNLQLTRNGVPISTAEIGIPIAVDAGTHSVTASAEGRPLKTFEALDVKDGTSASIVIDALPAELKRSESKASEGLPKAPPAEPPGEHPFWGPQRIAGLALGIGGLAGLGVGGAFAGLTKSAVDTSSELGCDDSGECPNQAALDEREDALLYAHVSTGTFIAGGALLFTGILVFATAPSGPVVSVGAEGVALRGTF